MMRKLFLSVFFLSFSLTCYGQNILGDWSGDLEVTGIKATLVLHVQQNDAGELTATIDNPDRNIKGISIDQITLDQDQLKFEIKELHASYEGSINHDQISGTFTQGGVSLPLTFKTGVQLKKRPQEPKPPFPYNEEDVSYVNAKANITLSGTLTFPKSSGPFPSVILITGSGPHDRNETIFGHKPFHVLADHLTRNGIAVLRVDDRGIGQSTGSFEGATTADFATDVLASIDYLKSRKEIDQQQIGLIGHSEGGAIAPIVATQSKDVRFIILMAGYAVPGEEIIYEQQELTMRLQGAPEDLISKNIEQQKKLFSILKSEQDKELAEKQLLDVLIDFPDQEVARVMVKTINSDWYRYFITHDPSKILENVTIPVLALFGELDTQVTPSQNLPLMSKILKQSGNKDFDIVEFPKLNHLFQTCQTGSITEYAQIEETIAPIVLKTISDWILKRVDTNTNYSK